MSYCKCCREDYDDPQACDNIPFHPSNNGDSLAHKTSISLPVTVSVPSMVSVPVSVPSTVFVPSTVSVLVYIPSMVPLPSMISYPLLVQENLWLDPLYQKWTFPPICSMTHTEHSLEILEELMKMNHPLPVMQVTIDVKHVVQPKLFHIIADLFTLSVKERGDIDCVNYNGLRDVNPWCGI